MENVLQSKLLYKVFKLLQKGLWKKDWKWKVCNAELNTWMYLGLRTRRQCHQTRSGWRPASCRSDPAPLSLWWWDSPVSLHWGTAQRLSATQTHTDTTNKTFLIKTTFIILLFLNIITPTCTFHLGKHPTHCVASVHNICGEMVERNVQDVWFNITGYITVIWSETLWSLSQDAHKGPWKLTSGCLCWCLRHWYMLYDKNMVLSSETRCQKPHWVRCGLCVKCFCFVVL